MRIDFDLRFARTAIRHASAIAEASVIQRGVRHLHAREARNHRLEFVEELQRPLARFGLIGRVGAVELTSRGDRPYGCRNVMLVSAGAEKTAKVARLASRVRT